ncbi:MAG: LytTR family DNA-binding domain-containing protein [Prevotellaceae bacterium]|jgi:DNA-binding LytR/AlgR family response regulator|nr:LytTR family DNA-binding domain-containing protein [Prevotellaceae bacterium]
MDEIKKYRAIIVEDERLPMLSLIQKINEYHPDIEIIGTCDSAASASETILKLKPDVLFLDIQLSDNDSLWLLDHLQTGMSELPYVIFTTAYNNPEYIIRAVRFQAVDYLLKPVNIIELAKAIIRMKKKAVRRAETSGTSEHSYSFRTLNSTLIATAMDIAYFEADGNYCKLFTAKYTEESVFERLGDVETKLLPSALFIRAGKSHLINKKYIYKIDAKKQVCHLTSLIGMFYRVPLSAKGIGALLSLLDE